jgi:hypothetical protein
MNSEILELQGWMDHVELDWLYHTAQKVPEGGLIVEIGAWKGRSSAALYEGTEHKNTTISIDTWKGQDDLPTHEEARVGDLLQVYLNNMKMLGHTPVEIFSYLSGKFDTATPGEMITGQEYGMQQIKPGYPLSTGPYYMVSDSVKAAQYFADQSIDFLFIDGDHRLCGEDIDAFLPKMKPDGLLTGHDYFCFYETIQQEIHKRFYIHQLVSSIWVRHVGLYKPEWY